MGDYDPSVGGAYRFVDKVGICLGENTKSQSGPISRLA
jgi:hypothetical protein